MFERVLTSVGDSCTLSKRLSLMIYGGSFPRNSSMSLCQISASDFFVVSYFI